MDNVYCCELSPICCVSALELPNNHDCHMSCKVGLLVSYSLSSPSHVLVSLLSLWKFENVLLAEWDLLYYRYIFTKKCTI